MQLVARTLALTGVLFLTACAMTGKNDVAPSEASPAVGEAMQEASRATIAEAEASSEDVEINIERPYKSAYGEIALDQNEHVDKWVRYFQGKGRGHMVTYLSRSGRYLPMMKNVLRENGLPEDLVYIALIESGFSPRAHSRANAVGYWQFIRGTGKRFGLQLDPFIDERRDPVLSTRAAVEYFKALYNMLGSWHLSMAAYNVGENRVKRSVAKYRTNDFWELIRHRRALPPETRNYVPKFIAATMIAKDPAKFGFTEVEYQDPLSYDTVALQSPISLSKLAANINVEVEELKLLNPKFRTDFVPISRGGETVVRIPVGRATDALAALSMSVTTQPKVLQAEYFYYRIRRGDNLSTIAKRHRTTVSRLRRLNGLSNRTLLNVGRRLKVPDNGGEGIKYVTEEEARTPSNAVPAVDVVAAERPEYHVVRRGENLSLIAQRYGLSVERLLQMNGFSARSVIRKGQKIRIREDKGNESVIRGKKRPLALAKFSSKSEARAKSMQREIGTPKRGNRAAAHVVRRGETLSHLSQRYGVSLSELAKHNKIRWNHRVIAGEKIFIP